ncbi:unnamed protein product, partial [Ectocarpus sp. 4 AP-2014]
RSDRRDLQRRCQGTRTDGSRGCRAWVGISTGYVCCSWSSRDVAKLDIGKGNYHTASCAAASSLGRCKPLDVPRQALTLLQILVPWSSPWLSIIWPQEKRQL